MLHEHFKKYKWKSVRIQQEKKKVEISLHKIQKEKMNPYNASKIRDFIRWNNDKNKKKKKKYPRIRRVVRQGKIICGHKVQRC